MGIVKIYYDKLENVSYGYTTENIDVSFDVETSPHLKHYYRSVIPNNTIDPYYRSDKRALEYRDGTYGAIYYWNNSFGNVSSNYLDAPNFNDVYFKDRNELFKDRNELFKNLNCEYDNHSTTKQRQVALNGVETAINNLKNAEKNLEIKKKELNIIISRQKNLPAPHYNQSLPYAKILVEEAEEAIETQKKKVDEAKKNVPKLTINFYGVSHGIYTEMSEQKYTEYNLPSTYYYKSKNINKLDFIGYLTQKRSDNRRYNIQQMSSDNDFNFKEEYSFFILWANNPRYWAYAVTMVGSQVLGLENILDFENKNPRGKEPGQNFYNKHFKEGYINELVKYTFPHDRPNGDLLNLPNGQGKFKDPYIQKIRNASLKNDCIRVADAFSNDTIYSDSTNNINLVCESEHLLKNWIKLYDNSSDQTENGLIPIKNVEVKNNSVIITVDASYNLHNQVLLSYINYYDYRELYDKYPKAWKERYNFIGTLGDKINISYYDNLMGRMYLKSYVNIPIIEASKNKVNFDLSDNNFKIHTFSNYAIGKLNNYRTIDGKGRAALTFYDVTDIIDNISRGKSIVIKKEVPLEIYYLDLYRLSARNYR